MSYEPFQEPPGGFEPPVGYPPPPIPPPPPPAVRQLVRDPYTKLGGVASGLAHHYGIDVSLVRLLFVAFTILTGFGIPIYIVAWIIIPRAQYWPPVGTRKPNRPLTAREIGIGLLLVGALIALFVNGGAFSQIMVPLALIAGGIWVLAQPPSEETGADSADVFGAAGAAVPPPVDIVDPGAGDPAAFGTAGVGAAPVGTPPVGTAPVGTLAPGSPVPPRRRRWRPVLFGFLLLFLALPVVGVIALLSSDIDFDSDFKVEYQPVDVESVRSIGSISHNPGEIIVDLTDLDSSMFDGETIPLEIDQGFGEVRVVVPEDLVVSVDADVGIGDIKVFGSSDDGIGLSRSVGGGDADIDLKISVGAGQIVVERGSSSTVLDQWSG